MQVRMVGYLGTWAVPPACQEASSAGAAKVPPRVNSISFILSFTAAIALSSVIEWVVHKHFMHSTRIMRTPHRKHAVLHHAERRAPGRFFAKEEELKEYHLFETSFMPILWMLHFPLFALIYVIFGQWSSFGVALGTACYTLMYEVLHWSIHCPDTFWFRNSGWFLFLTEHHRRHHNRSDINYNVVCPLADWMFGTLSFRQVRGEPEPGEAAQPQESAAVGTGQR